MQHRGIKLLQIATSLIPNCNNTVQQNTTYLSNKCKPSERGRGYNKQTTSTMKNAGPNRMRYYSKHNVSAPAMSEYEGWTLAISYMEPHSHSPYISLCQVTDPDPDPQNTKDKDTTANQRIPNIIPNAVVNNGIVFFMNCCMPFHADERAVVSWHHYSSHYWRDTLGHRIKCFMTMFSMPCFLCFGQ